MIMLVTVCNDVVAVMGGGGAFVIYRSETMKGALPCQLANESFARICRASSQQSKNSTLVGLHNAERDGLDRELLEMMRLRYSHCAKVCRSFWANIPPKTPEQHEKLRRLYEGMQKLDNIVQDLRRQVPSGQKNLGLSMVRPILGSLEKAILFYEHHIAPQSTAQSAQSGILSASSSNNTEGAAVKKVSFSLKRPQENRPLEDAPPLKRPNSK